jgi:aryl carrier-like protein
MHAKALGAWNLHRHTADRALTHFVLFSSSTAFIAGPGHGPYAAANAFLDGLSHYRHSLSLPATSIEWGFWSGLGIAAGSQSEAQLVESGVGVIPADTGIEILDRLLAEPAAVTAVLPCDWEKLGTTLHSVAGRPLFAKLLADRPAERLAAARAEILSVPPVERVAYVQNYVVRELARVMQLEPDEIDVDKPLNQLGMDSLMGLELKSRWEGDFKTKLPISELVESPTIAELSVKLVKLVENPEIAAAAQEAGGEDAEEQLKAALSQLEDASGDELEALLTQRGPSSNGTGHAYSSVDLAWLERASEPQIARRLQAIAQPSTTKPPSAEAPPPTAAPASS